MARLSVAEKLAIVKAWLEEQGRGVSIRTFAASRNVPISSVSKWTASRVALESARPEMKNVARRLRYPEEDRVLTEFIVGRDAIGEGTTVLDVVSHALSCGMLSESSYINRYMFCRRVLFAVRLRSVVGQIVTISSEHHVSDKSHVRELEAACDFEFIESTFIPSGLKPQVPFLGMCNCSMTCESGCVNGACSVECDLENYSVGEQCGNRWVGRGIESQLEVFETERSGFGLRSVSAVLKRQLVVEYCGEYKSCEDYHAERATWPPGRSTYFLDCRVGYGVDATSNGNLARFANHSCCPNMYAEKRVVAGLTRVFFVSARAIAAGEELTFSYDEIDFDCRCSLHED